MSQTILCAIALAAGWFTGVLAFIISNWRYERRRRASRGLKEISHEGKVYLIDPDYRDNY